MRSVDFRTEQLNREGKRIAEAILGVLPETASGGGCTAFYTPEQWRNRGETYGRDSALVIVHDGGDLAPYFNYDRERYNDIERMNEALARIGYYAENCTSWYSAAYPISSDIVGRPRL